MNLLGSRTELLLALATATLVVMFVVVLLAVPDRSFADDSYFYFLVAWNFARGMGSTFNTIMPTNGYHPLWMLICIAVFHFVPSRPSAVHAIAAVICSLDLLTLFVVSRLANRFAGHLWPIAFLLLVPFSFGSQLGTEGALSCLFLSLLMLTAYQFSAAPSPRTAVLFSLVAALAVLSRLDNIFIVSFVSLAVWLAPANGTVSLRRRLQLAAAAIPAVLWGAYIASNWIFFHTIQPISGMLKSGSARDHTFGANLPHTALVALAVVIPSFLVVALRRRDLFFRVVELPFFLGVLCHACYISFVLSSETRWTWYYTSWILLGSILLARAALIVLVEHSRIAVLAAVCCTLIVAGAWYEISYLKFLKGPETVPPASFNAEVYGKLGIRRALAYDEPGVYAYYSDIQIVPVDGLMGDLKFQKDLATKGVQEFVDREHIDAFIGPVSPVRDSDVGKLCDRVFLSSERFRCDRQPDGRYKITGVDIYARIPSQNAGTLALRDEDAVWKLPRAIEVWRLRH